MLLVAAGFGACAASAQAAGRDRKEIRLFQVSQLFGIGEVIEKIRSAGSGRQKAPTPDRISEIQQALAKDGSFTGTFSRCP